MDQATRKMMVMEFLKEDFDKTEVYENEIEPLFNLILKLCKTHKIPFVGAACFANNAETGAFSVHNLCTFHGIGTTPLNFYVAEKLLGKPKLSTQIFLQTSLSGAYEGVEIESKNIKH